MDAVSGLTKESSAMTGAPTRKRRDLNGLAMFALVARCGSLRRAAALAHVSPSAVSHAMRRLEDELGVRLLARTTRAAAPTPEGRRLVERLGPALGAIDEALLDLAGPADQPSGILRITLPHVAARNLIVPRAAQFAADHPGIVLELCIDDGRVDLVDGEFDAGIRLEESLEQDMISTRIGGDERLVVAAAPAAISRHGRPQHPADLAKLPCVLPRLEDGALHEWVFEKDDKPIRIRVGGQLIVNDDAAMVRLLEDGAGFGLVFASAIEAKVASGALVTMLDDWCPPFPGFRIYFPSRRQMRPALRAFLDFYGKSQSLRAGMTGTHSAATSNG